MLVMREFTPGLRNLTKLIFLSNAFQSNIMEIIKYGGVNSVRGKIISEILSNIIFCIDANLLLVLGSLMDS
jgi:hypothetical protein